MARRPSQERRGNSKPDTGCNHSVSCARARSSSRQANNSRNVTTSSQRQGSGITVKSARRNSNPSVVQLVEDIKACEEQKLPCTSAEFAASARAIQLWWRQLQGTKLRVEQVHRRDDDFFAPVPAAVLTALSLPPSGMRAPEVVPGPEDEIPKPEFSELGTVVKLEALADSRCGQADFAHGLPSFEQSSEEHTGPTGKELPNNSRFFVQQLEKSNPCQPYCPSTYAALEDVVAQSQPVPALSPTDRVAQMRSKIKSLQELRGQADHGEARPPVFQPLSPQPALQPQLRDQADHSEVRPPVLQPLSLQPSMQPEQKQARPPPLQQLSPAPQPEDRLASIMTFLDEVEESSRLDISSIVSSARSSNVLPPTSGIDSARSFEPTVRHRAVPSSLSQDAAALRARAGMLEVEVNDKKQIINSLKQALGEAKQHEKKIVEETNKECEDKTQKLKAHYEAGLERHLRLVDRLLNDKTELTKRCELFAEELKAVERKFQMKVEDLDDKAAKELAKNKQNWMATERLKREAWEKEKVKEIKEMTVKGLQPEVERILAERKQEKSRMEERHRDALEEQRRELMDLAQQQVRDVREQKIREQEEALDREREAHRRKLRDEFERFNQELQDERARCAADLLCERRKREEMLREGNEGFEAKLQEAVEKQRFQSEAALQEVRASAAEAERQHRLELSNLEERLRTENGQAQGLHAEEARLELERREAALRAELVAERDKQLEVVMERLSREHVEQQRVLKEDVAKKVEEARSAAGAEAGRVAKQLDEAKGQLVAVLAEKGALEQMAQNLKDRLGSDTAQLAGLEQRCRDLETERAELQRVAERNLEEHREELDKMHAHRGKELEGLRSELRAASALVAEEQAKLEEQRRESRCREEQIIADLETKVKRALQVKDETIAELQTRCAALENKVREFEYLLERQREELLGGLTRIHA